MTTTLEPVHERIIALDVVRGFALFGVLMVNMLDFSGSALRAGTLGSRGSEIDQILDLAITFLAVTKFYLLFSFLFGVGFAVQMQRMERSGRPFVGFYLRRLGILFAIGMLHAILLWDGDILRLYAVAGLMLLAVRHVSTPKLLAAAGLIALSGFIVFGAMSDLSQFSDLMGLAEVDLYRHGSYGDLVTMRAAAPHLVDIQLPMVLVMFLVGLVVGRSAMLDQEERYRPFVSRWWKPMLLLGLIGNALMVYGYAITNTWLISFGVHVGAPALSFVYLGFVLLHVERLRWLASVGQMALTNYLTHSLVCSTLFYGYGFALYDQLPPWMTTALVFVIFGSQVVISALWMRVYRFGLMEWLWRSLTYGRIQPLQHGLGAANKIDAAR